MTVTSARQAPAPTTEGDPAARARDIALRILTGAPHSAISLRDKLIKRDVSPGIADHVIRRYREVGLLDDSELAVTIARTRHRERGHARRLIALELLRKGFEAADVEEALGQISDQDEEHAAYSLAVKRWRRLAGLPAEVRARRLVAMLGRKGYALSMAYGLVKRLESSDILGSE